MVAHIVSHKDRVLSRSARLALILFLASGFGSPSCGVIKADGPLVKSAVSAVKNVGQALMYNVIRPPVKWMQGALGPLKSKSTAFAPHIRLENKLNLLAFDTWLVGGQQDRPVLDPVRHGQRLGLRDIWQADGDGNVVASARHYQSFSPAQDLKVWRPLFHNLPFLVAETVGWRGARYHAFWIPKARKSVMTEPRLRGKSKEDILNLFVKEAAPQSEFTQNSWTPPRVILDATTQAVAFLAFQERALRDRDPLPIQKGSPVRDLLDSAVSARIKAKDLPGFSKDLLASWEPLMANRRIVLGAPQEGAPLSIVFWQAIIADAEGLSRDDGEFMPGADGVLNDLRQSLLLDPVRVWLNRMHAILNQRAEAGEGTLQFSSSIAFELKRAWADALLCPWKKDARVARFKAVDAQKKLKARLADTIRNSGDLAFVQQGWSQAAQALQMYYDKGLKPLGYPQTPFAEAWICALADLFLERPDQEGSID